MKKGIFVLLVLALVLSMAPVALAQTNVDPGTGKTNVFMQNLGTSNAQVQATFYTETTGAMAWNTTLEPPIPAKGAKYLLYTQFGGNVTDNWAGAAELAATEPLAAIVNMFWDGTAGTAATAATYTGVDAPAMEAYLAGLAKSANRQTRVTIQNTESTAADIDLMFYDRDGSLTGTLSDSLAAKAEKTYYLDQVAEADFSATGGNGALYVTSTTNIAAMASIHSPTWSVGYSGVASGDTVVWVPGVFRRASGGNWQLFSAIVVQNLGDQAADITIDLIGTPGNPSSQVADVIPAKASYGINTRSVGTMPQDKWDTLMNPLGTNWQGSARITCTNGQNLTGAGFYFPVAATDDALGYNAIKAMDATDMAISMPAVYRKQGTANDQISTTLVQNLDETDGTVNVKFYRADGTVAGNAAGYNANLPAGSSIRLNLKTGLELPAQALTDLGTGFSGAMYIESTSGNSIIAITNIIYETMNFASGYPGFPIQ